MVLFTKKEFGKKYLIVKSNTKILLYIIHNVLNNNQVTANFLDNQSENGNKATINNANIHWPPAAAHAPFIKINAITPALTDFPMAGPVGCRIAFSRGW